MKKTPKISKLRTDSERAHWIGESDAFRPPWYLRSGHVQTIITGFYRPKPKLARPIEHRVPLGENGFGLVFENRPDKVSPGYPDTAVFLLHGMGSSHAGTYMTSITARLLDRGLRVFRADLPGAGGSYKFTSLPPHGACFNEVRQMLDYLADQFEIRRWRAAGVSLGGNILLKLAAQEGRLRGADGRQRQVRIERAVAVAPPIQLAACSRNMEKGLNRLYAGYFMRILRKQSEQRAAIWPQWAECLKKASFRSIRSFDETMTAPLAGFGSADEYYAAGSSFDELESIDVPTTILIDRHDPIVPASVFDQARFSRTTQVKSTRYGGHVGYLQRTPARLVEDGSNAKLHRWADGWVIDELLR